MGKTYVEKATRWWDVLETVKDRPTVGPLPGADSSSIEKGDYFSGASWDDAVRMMRDGWREGAERLSTLLDRQADAAVMEPQWSVEAAGHFPCVPAYLSGSPECMYALEDVEATRPRLCLVVPMNYPGVVEAEQVLRYGAAVAAIVRALEAAGNDVCVISMGKSKSQEDGQDTMVYPIIVRDFGEPLDLSVVAFAFHPAFLRRISFAWRERHPLAVKIGIARDGYGIPQPVTEEDCRKALGDDIATPVILPQVHAVDPVLLWSDSALPELVETFRQCVRKALSQ